MWPDNKDNKQQRRVNQTLEKTEIVNKDTISGNPVSSKHSGNKTKLSVLRLGWFDSQQGITLVNGALQSVLFVRISVVAWLCGTPPPSQQPPHWKPTLSHPHHTMKGEIAFLQHKWTKGYKRKYSIDCFQKSWCFMSRVPISKRVDPKC